MPCIRSVKAQIRKSKSYYLPTFKPVIDNPRPVGLWPVAHFFFLGGGGVSASPVISQTAGPISKIQTPFDSPVRELFKYGMEFDLEVIDDVTGHVKVRMLNFSGLVTSASTISMLSASKANESMKHG